MRGRTPPRESPLPPPADPATRTLRATVEWSAGLLEEAERSLLEVAAVFADGWTIQPAAKAAALEENRALELSEELARHSLISRAALRVAGQRPDPLG